MKTVLERLVGINMMTFDDKDTLVEMLLNVRDYLLEEDLEETDVRLVMWDGGAWDLKEGDVQYDTAIAPYCAASIVTIQDDLESIEDKADGLIADIEDCIAESEGE